MVSGCTSFRVLAKPRGMLRPALTEGMIVVGRPEVFAFNRIIDQTQQDIQLLEPKLDAYDPERFQAMREIRVFESISEPAGEIEERPVNSEDQRETASPLQEGEPAEALTANESDTQKVTPQAIPSSTQPKAAADKGSDRKLRSPGRLPETKAKLTSYDQVQYEMVYRDMINSEILSIIRDNCLALMGYTIHSLNFNITVIPGINTYTLGEAALNMTVDQSVSEAFFRRWRKRLQTDLVEQAFGIQTRWISGNLSDREKVTLQQNASQLQHKLRERVETLERDSQDLKNRRQALNQDQEEESANIVKVEKETDEAR